ncbi:MAG: serine/threonine protein kinase [Myxococcales bacterium]|nr:serine/threonine protein kinase [Myxococcales bacterium]MCB9717432.1 serine/threonine protein kinase [Myxococcales bacterium]
MDLPTNRQHTIRGLSPGTRLGRYAVVRRIGSGGMAELYLARLDGPEGFAKAVALKLMHPYLSDDAHFARMFLKEARIAAQIEHPSIVQVLDVGEFGGEYFMALEFVHGKDLRRVLADQKGKPMPLGCALRVVMDVGRALHYAHRLRDPGGRALGIVHRDVSPSNVLISYQGAVKLADFGVAKVAERSNATASGMLKGKMGYMSPEQCLQEHVDARSDVFSLGVLLYEATTARRAFFAEQPVAVMNKVIDGRWRPPDHFVPGYPGALHEIVARALSVDVDKRFQSAEAMVEALERLAAELEIDTRVEALGGFMQERYGQPALPDLEVPTLDMARPRAPVTEVHGFAPMGSLESRSRSRRLVTGAALVGVLVLGGVLGWQVARSTDGAPAPAPAPAAVGSAPAPVQAAAVASPELPANDVAVAPSEPEAPPPTTEDEDPPQTALDEPTEDSVVEDEPAKATKRKGKRRKKRSTSTKSETERAREILFPTSSK